jgi:hypothetical protein
MEAMARALPAIELVWIVAYSSSGRSVSTTIARSRVRSTTIEPGTRGEAPP